VLGIRYLQGIGHELERGRGCKSVTSVPDALACWVGPRSIYVHASRAEGLAARTPDEKMRYKYDRDQGQH